MDYRPPTPTRQSGIEGVESCGRDDTIEAAAFTAAVSHLQCKTAWRESRATPLKSTSNCVGGSPAAALVRQDATVVITDAILLEVTRVPTIGIPMPRYVHLFIVATRRHNVRRYDSVAIRSKVAVVPNRIPDANRKTARTYVNTHVPFVAGLSRVREAGDQSARENRRKQ
jgi:hypothetical protein